MDDAQRACAPGTLAERMPPPSSVHLPALHSWRIRRGLTQDDLAAKISVRRATISRIESGHPALVKTAAALADALRVSIDDLMTEPS